MAPKPKKTTTIDSSGRVIITNTDENNDPNSSSFRSGGGALRSMTSTTIDTFGFNLDLRQFVIVLFLATIMLGTNGTLAFVIALGAYTAFNRLTTLSSSSSSSSGGGGGRGTGGGRWGGRDGGGGGGGGANIKGVKDLPKPPAPRGE